MMTDTNELLLSQFQYDLPDDRIARFPLPQRDSSKLLVYGAGQVSHAHFSDLPGLLPQGSYLVFNDTKVIPARLYFTKPTGAVIELFLLNPFQTNEQEERQPISQAMQATGSAIWSAMVGNRKRWKPSETLQTSIPTSTHPNRPDHITLTASWHDYESSAIQLSWQPATLSFAEVIQHAGEIPLPPYLKRDATDVDRETYQTVYSKQEGAVAAPTAGLHFTPAVFNTLAERGIKHDYLTLHVGAGTFQPIKTEDVRQHSMHTEQVVYAQRNVKNLLDHLDSIIAVGTTSMRALESLYWIGTKLIRQEADPLQLDQNYAYDLALGEQPSSREALQAVLEHMDRINQESLVAHTSIYITPGYTIKLSKGIITNFHQPGSTLILLIAALIGDEWRYVYNEALKRDYRFLSYGDSSLLLP